MENNSIHYNNKWKSIESFNTCPITGKLIKVERYLNNWDKLLNFREIKTVPVKQCYFNTGPTAYSKAKSFQLIEKNDVVGIFIVRYRNDGFGEDIYKWDGTVEEWETFSTEKESKELMKTLDRFNDM